MTTVTRLAAVFLLLLPLHAPPPGSAEPDNPIAAGGDPPRYRTYYSIFDRGRTEIPYLDTTSFVPQGLARWPEQDAMVVSYYDDNGGKARIAILDRVTSNTVKTLTLDDSGHVGGLATSANYLWVASTDGDHKRLIRYAKSTLAESPDGAEVARNADYPVPVSSFVEISGDKLYVGLFAAGEEGVAHRYTLDAAETPRNDNHSFAIPSNVQGMVITPEHRVWSRSFSQEEDSGLVVDPADGRPSRTIVAPNMSEDMAVVDGELYVLYESAARKFPDADYKVRTVHHGSLSDLT